MFDRMDANALITYKRRENIGKWGGGGRREEHCLSTICVRRFLHGCDAQGVMIHHMNVLMHSRRHAVVKTSEANVRIFASRKVFERGCGGIYIRRYWVLQTIHRKTRV